MSRPPLKKVAELAGVSEPTVSRVLNRKIGVAESTRTRVIEALKSLGYDEPPSANSPRRRVIGVVTGEFSNPVFTTFVDQLGIELGRRGFLASVALQQPDSTSETKCIDHLQRAGVDGMVFIAGDHSAVDGDLSEYRRLAEAGQPIVLVNGGDTGLPVTHIRCDETFAAIGATRHLLDLGHTRIGCVLGSREFVGTRRFEQGFAQAMTDAGLGASPADTVHVPYTLEGGRAGAKRLIQRGVTAVLCGNDLMALGAVKAGDAMGVPLSAVGYDGTDMTALTAPALTTMRQPFGEMTSLIADAVVGELQQPGSFDDTFVFEPTLVARDSTRAYDEQAFAGIISDTVLDTAD